MFWENFVGKSIQMDYEGKTVTFRLVKVVDDFIVGKTPTNIDIYIPFAKLGPFTVGEFDRLYVHNCKNEGVCKGYRLLALKKEIEWECKHHKTLKCSVVCAGEFDKLPTELRTKVLDGLHTTIPVVPEQVKNNKLKDLKDGIEKRSSVKVD